MCTCMLITEFSVEKESSNVIWRRKPISAFNFAWNMFVQKQTTVLQTL